jgi:hypothetical protein
MLRTISITMDLEEVLQEVPKYNTFQINPLIPSHDIESAELPCQKDDPGNQGSPEYFLG